MKPLKDKDLRSFVQNVRMERTESRINLPAIASKLGLNYFKQIKPVIESNQDFRDEIGQIFEELKFELMQNLLKGATEGKPKNRPSPEISYINAIIKIIDSGTLIGGAASDDSVTSDDSDLEAHKKRLGI